MASFICIVSLVLCASFMCTVCANKLVSLDCQRENHGVHGKDSLLNCTVKSSDKEMKIISFDWRRAGAAFYLLKVMKPKGDVKQEDARFSFAQSQMSSSSVDVSFLIRNTQRTDEGKYECYVVTDSGEDQATVSLYVTATYSQPDMSSVPEEDIMEDMEITLFCNASGGYPVGMIHWYDQHNTNWTASAITTAVETSDKRINLTSKFTLRASSTYPLYRCSVLNKKGEEVGEAELQLPFKVGDPERVEGDKNSTAVAAIVVVAGSLLCGLLILAVLRRRRTRQDRRMSTHPIMSETYEYESPDPMEKGSTPLNTGTEESVSQP